MIRTAYQILAGAIYQRHKPEVDMRYRAFIRQFPCIGCGRERHIEFMHTGPRGLGQLADDKDGLPGCRECHRTGPQALHKIGPVRFQLVHNIDFADLRAMFRSDYERRYGK